MLLLDSLTFYSAAFIKSRWSATSVSVLDTFRERYNIIKDTVYIETLESSRDRNGE